jgi:hypothetical protein
LYVVWGLTWREEGLGWCRHADGSSPLPPRAHSVAAVQHQHVMMMHRVSPLSHIHAAMDASPEWEYAYPPAPRLGSSEQQGMGFMPELMMSRGGSPTPPLPQLLPPYSRSASPMVRYTAPMVESSRASPPHRPREDGLAPPCGHIKNQSCLRLGSAFEAAAFLQVTVSTKIAGMRRKKSQSMALHWFVQPAARSSESSERKLRNFS